MLDTDPITNYFFIGSDKERIEHALYVAFNYGQIDGGHHKAWCIDQMVRILTGDGYDHFVQEYKVGDDGPETYEWDIGIAP